MLIRDVMTPCPYMINARASLDEAVRKMDSHSVRHLPVVEKGELMGVLSERDVRLSQFVCKATNYCPDVGETCVAELLIVKENQTASEVALQMAERKIDCALVCSEDETIVGIFTTTDACRLVSRLLPTA